MTFTFEKLIVYQKAIDFANASLRGELEDQMHGVSRRVVGAFPKP